VSGPGLAAWLRDFRDLHERARKGALKPGEESTYQASREELSRAVLAAQKLTLKPGETPRRALRVSRALQIDVEMGTTSQRSVTMDLSTGGFATLLAMPPAMGDLMSVTLRLPGAEQLSCRARIVEVKPLPGSTRVAARFVDLSRSEVERLEMVVIDTVLAMLQG
jgi:hypothetical protein